MASVHSIYSICKLRVKKNVNWRSARDRRVWLIHEVELVLVARFVPHQCVAAPVARLNALSDVYGEVFQRRRTNTQTVADSATAISK